MIPLFLLSFIPRAAYFFFLGGVKSAPLPGSNYYWSLSENLLRHGILGLGGVRSTAYELLYPLFLALSRWLVRDYFPLVILIQIAIASLGVVYFYKLCLRLSGKKSVAWMGSLFYSFYPYSLRQAGAIIEVPILTTLLILSACLYCRATNIRHFAVAGAVLGLTLLMRLAVLPVFLLASTLLFFKGHLKHAFVFIASALLLLFPFLLRNYPLNGSIQLTRNGLNFFEANCEYTDKVLPDYSTDLLTPYAFKLLRQEKGESLLSEKEIDKFFMEKAVAFIQANPLRTLRTRLLNVVYFFHFRIVPFYPMRENTRLILVKGDNFRVEGISRRSQLHEWAHSLAYGFIFLTALCGQYLRRDQLLRQDAFLLFIVLGFVAVYSLYFPSTRLRMPMEFVLMFYSAFAVNRWVSRRA